MSNKKVSDYGLDQWYEDDEINDEYAKNAILDLAKQFVESPARFHNENKVEDELKRNLRDNDDEITIGGEYIIDSVNDGEEKYGKELSRNADCDPVQSQLNIGLSSSFEQARVETVKDLPGIGEYTEEKIKEEFEPNDDAELLKRVIHAEKEELTNVTNIGESTADDIVEYTNKLDLSKEPDDDGIKKIRRFVENVKNNSNDDDGIGRSNVFLDIGILQPADHPILNSGNIITEPSFEEEPDVEFCIAGGAQFWPPSSISHAFEIKYFKTMSSPGNALLEEEETWDRIQSDVEELKSLVKYGPDQSTEAHLIIVSNMDIFKKGENTEEDNEDSLEAVRNQCGEDIHLWYIHPETDQKNNE